MSDRDLHFRESQAYDMPTPFDEVEAATKLGFPGERFDSIAPYMFDDVYWVVIGRGDAKVGRPVIVARGHLLADAGYDIGMAWLRRIAANAKPDLNTDAVPQVLRWYDSLPIGWSGNEIYDPQTKESSRIRLAPIEVKLVAGVRIPPRARTTPSPSSASSTGPSWPAGGPSPSAGGPSGPGGGPSPGYSPPRPSRATLREVDGKLTWILETYEQGTWLEELRDPAER